MKKDQEYLRIKAIIQVFCDENDEQYPGFDKMAEDVATRAKNIGMLNDQECQYFIEHFTIADSPYVRN